MSDNLVIPKMFPLQQLVLHEMAKNVWNILVSQHSEKMILKSKDILITKNLLSFRDKVLEILPDILPTGFPELLKDKLVYATITIKLGYNEAFDWISWYDGYITTSLETRDHGDFEQNRLNSLYSALKPDMGQYEAIRFIDPLGHFDDLAWGKIFVADESQPLKGRFFLACIYCFEEDINSLWRIVKDDNQLLIIIFATSRYNHNDLISTWVSRLKEENGDRFNARGFNAAFNGFHEHAANYFWKRCSDEERTRLLSEIDIHEVILAARRRRVGFVYFVYSLLYKEFIKANHLTSVVRECQSAWIWGCMISSHYKIILNDILTPSYFVHAKFYGFILNALVYPLKNSFISLHKKIFEILWSRLTQDQRNEIVGSSYLLLNLMVTDDVDLFKMVILPLPRWLKEDILLNNIQCACPMYLFNFHGVNDHEIFLHYLLFFFLEHDAVTQKLTLRSDAADLYHRFTNNGTVPLIRYLGACKAVKIDWLLENFNETLPTLNELINLSDHAICTTN